MDFLSQNPKVGHSLGSGHDPVEECGGGAGGRFLMWAGGSLGTRPNNMRLSSCSLANISAVLAVRPVRCLTQQKELAVCGNRWAE